MGNYALAPGAEEDLWGIATYTIKNWGEEQASRYEAALESHFDAIGKSEVHARVFLSHRPELRVSRCEHHYVFFLERKNGPPLILAVFHKSMDLMARLKSRLTFSES